MGGRPVRGYADACLAPRGRAHGQRCRGLYADLLDGWLVHHGDEVDRAGVPARVTVRADDILMRDPQGASRVAGAALDLALTLRPSPAERTA